MPDRRPRTVVVAVLAAVLLTLQGCSGPDGDDLTLVGFALPKNADEAAQAAFARTSEGAGTEWIQSYGASGDQSRAVARGLRADVVHFSVTPDLTRLVDAGLVGDDWDDDRHGGIMTESVVVLVVRAGNPLGIEGWDDLARPGLEVVTPNPGSSGAARWNVLGAWLHVAGDGGSDAEATRFLARVLANVEALPGSGREATAAFQSGTGDVLISSENEAILARQSGEDLEYLVPDDTLLIQNPGAVTRRADPRAADFLDFVRSAAGQTVYAAAGFRPLRTVVGVEVGTVGTERV